MSTLIFDSVTRAELDVATTDAQWASILNNALGNNRRIRCWRDANANATNPELSGVEFRNVGSTGPLQVIGGCLAGLGTIKGTTISLAADMSSGKSVLRMEGNGRWMQGALGLKGSGADFTVPASFTANNGLGIYGHFCISGKNLPSGQGKPPPAKTDAMPHTFELWDYGNASSPVLVGSVNLDVRDQDWVYQDAELGADIGDAAWYRASNLLTLGDYSFGCHLFLSDASNTIDGSAPLQEVLIQPTFNLNKWPTLPESDTYDRKNHILNPTPFKIVMKDKNGNVLHTFQMRDGLPINDLLMKNMQGADQRTYPVRPFFNVFMQLPWWNVMPRINGKANKYYPGLTPEARRITLAKSQTAVLSCEPLVSTGYEGYSTNSLANMWSADQWPRTRTDWYPNGNPPFTPDPYLPYTTMNYGSPDHAGWVEGWDYEPGSYSGHNWYTAPGGPRFDRAFIPSKLALYLTMPNGHRPQQSVPYRDFLRGWALAYCNHSNHYCEDPVTLKFRDDPTFIWTDFQYVGNYYGGGVIGPKNIYQNAGANRDANFNPPNACDAQGNNICNGWGRDSLHDYATAGWIGLTLASPMMAILSKWDTKSAFMMHGRPEWDATGSYLVRSDAWHWLHHVIAWKVAANHPLGFSREDIEARFCEHLLMLYNKIYVPTYVTMSTDRAYESLRRFGQLRQDDVGNTAVTSGGGLGHYMSGVLMLMKQTGMWKAIYDKGGKVRTALLMVLNHLDQHAFGIFSQTGASATLQYKDSNGNDYTSRFQVWSGITWDRLVTYSDGSDTPRDYAELWQHMNAEMQASPRPGLWDLIHQAGVRTNNPDVSMWPTIQHCYIRRDYFPEIPKHPWQDDALAKLDGYLAQVTTEANAYIASGDTDPAHNPDHVYCYPGVAPINPPTELGPA